MKIDESTLKNIEKLAKLEVSEADKALTLKKIASVLDSMDKVDMAEIAELEPLYHPLEINQPMREDIANPDIPRDSIQAQSPLVEGGLFLVPKVIE